MMPRSVRNDIYVIGIIILAIIVTTGRELVILCSIDTPSETLYGMMTGDIQPFSSENVE
jgi:hypothetical protein